MVTTQMQTMIMCQKMSKDCDSHSLKFFCSLFCSLTLGHVWDHRHGNDLGEEDDVLKCDEKSQLRHKHLVVERGPFAIGIVEPAVAVQLKVMKKKWRRKMSMSILVGEFKEVHVWTEGSIGIKISQQMRTLGLN